MGRTIVLEVPDRLYESLERVAGQVGQPFEQVAVEWLAVANQVLSEDPLDQFIGVLRTDRINWADDHDHYLAEASRRKMQTSERESSEHDA